MSLLFPSPRILQTTPWRHKRVGLLGGSFNPPHAGHVHVSRIALRMLELDCVWWLVSPQNPFKRGTDTAPLDTRLQACGAMAAAEPRIVVSNLETVYGTVRTADTLEHLLVDFPQTQFVWVSGQDIPLQFHRWDRWRQILAAVPTAHAARPPVITTVRGTPLKMNAAQAHIHLTRPCRVPLEPGCTYWLPATRLDSTSSTGIRAASP